MRFGSQKKKIISLVLVFGFIYAVNACAHSNGLQGQFYIINGAPSVPVPSDQSDDFGNITIGNFKTNKKTSSNDPCIFITNNITIITSETASPGKTKTIRFKTIGDATHCDADIKYGDKKSKYITPITITWEKDTAVTTITSITATVGSSLDDTNFKAWKSKLFSHNAVMTVGQLTKDNGTLTYTGTLIAGAITLINNAPKITDKADKSNDISFKMPDPSTLYDCTWVNEDGSVLSQATVSPADPTKQVLFKPFEKNKENCFMDIVVGLGTKSEAITPVEVDKSENNSLTVKIDTSSHTTSSTNSMSTTASPLAAFNTWNNAFAVKYGSMMKLDLSKPGQVNFYNPPLPFPLLALNPKVFAGGKVITNSLDYLADDLLSQDLPTAIFDHYTHSQKKSRDIALNMLIAAGMMKEHSQIPDDSHNVYRFKIWKDYFETLNSGLTFVSWCTLNKNENGEYKTEYWKCNNDGDLCYLPFNDLHTQSKWNDYPVGKSPDDTLAQTYSAAAFLIASKALEDAHDTSKDPDGSPWSETYKDISQRMQDAILKNNRSNNSKYNELNGTQTITLTRGSDSKRTTSHTTYSDTILPLIYLFTQDDTSSKDLVMWNDINTNTIAIEHALLGQLNPRGAPNNILGAGYKEKDPELYDDQINAGDVASSLDPTDPGSIFKPSSNWTFGSSHDDADYVPMSLGAYLLVSGVYAAQNGPLITSSYILRKEMKDIDAFDSDDNGKFDPPYDRIKCSMKRSTWSCYPIIYFKTTKPLGLTPLDMSSYLLAQLGLDVFFGRADDLYPPKTTDGHVDNSAQITSLTSSFKSKIKAYVDSKGTDNPIDVSTLSSIMIEGLYIDGAFTATLKDATGKSSFHNPLIDGHINKTSKDIHYYFTLDPSTSSTLGAQVPAGAQTSYSGE